MRRRSLAAVVAVAALAGCTSGDRDGTATITITPAVAPMDQPVNVRLTGLGDGRATTVTATATDIEGRHWTATADFRAGPDGTLDLRDAAPTGGAYRGADPMGLFLFMSPDDGKPAYGFGPSAVARSYDVRFTATVDGQQVATATATRQLPPGLGVTSKPLTVARDGVSGFAYSPKDTSTRKPAVLVFGGSEGGLGGPVVNQAQNYASHGYPTLALAYFREPGLPRTLTAIPLEYFRKALEILRAQPGVDPAHVLVSGSSYGGEGSLLVAATYPDLVHGVVAIAPNSYVSPGPGFQSRSAWSLGGKELPRGPFGVPAAQVDPRAYIPVQRIRGPVLLACGDLDTQWASCRNSADVVARLGGRKDVTVARYPDAGHYVAAFVPYTATIDAGLTGAGGSVPGTLAANVDLHRRILALLAAQ